jgi:excisionase family DNA binding protein
MTESAMTVREVATYLNVNEKTVYRLAQRRELPGFKVAGAWRFRREDIDRWIEVQKQAGTVLDEGDKQRGRGAGHH